MESTRLIWSNRCRSGEEGGGTDGVLGLIEVMIGNIRGMSGKRICKRNPDRRIYRTGIGAALTWLEAMG